jgi:predicted transcriptional regulator
MSKQDWKEGTVQEFLGLSDVDMALVETKVALTRALRHQRKASRLTQSDVAHAMRTSQSRLARIEAGDPSVSLDLVFKALYTVGMTPQDVGRFIKKVVV